MKSINWELFEPNLFTDEAAVVILPNHLGSTLEDDFGYKAQQVANHLGTFVIGYERPGSGRANLANLRMYGRLGLVDFVDVAAQTGYQLSNIVDRFDFTSVTLGGNSAAGFESLAVGATQTVPFDGLVAVDPVGTRFTGFVEGLHLWGKQELSEKPKAPTWQQNDDGITVPMRTQIARASIDIANYGRGWRTPVAKELLAYLATQPAFADRTIGVLFPGHTFTDSPENLDALSNELNSLRPDEAPATFTSYVDADLYHHYFDKPLILADAVNWVRSLRGVSQKEFREAYN